MKNVLLYYTQPSMPICYCQYFYTKVLSIHLETLHMLEYRRSYFTCILWPPVPIDIHTQSALNPSWNTSHIGMLKIIFYMYFMTTSADIYSYPTCPGSILKYLTCWNIEDRILHVFYDHQCRHLFIPYVPRIHLETPHVLECWRSYFTCILKPPVPICYWWYSYTNCSQFILKHLKCRNVEDRILHVFYVHQCQ